MICSNCGAAIDASSSFCDFCGAPVETRGHEDTATYRTPVTQAPAAPLSPGRLTWLRPRRRRVDAGPTAVCRATRPSLARRAPRDGSAAGTCPEGRRGVFPERLSARTPIPPSPAVLPGSPILLGYQERILRQYAAVQLRSRAHGEGTLYVTDSRVVFYAKAKGRGTQRGSTLVQQTNVADITGLTAYVSRRVSLILFCLTAVFLLFALSSSFFAARPVSVLLVYPGRHLHYRTR